MTLYSWLEYDSEHKFICAGPFTEALVVAFLNFSVLLWAHSVSVSGVRLYSPSLERKVQTELISINIFFFLVFSSLEAMC